MKKLLMLFLGALTIAPLADAAILGVRNGTKKKMLVMGVGSDYNFNSLNAIPVDPGAEAILGGTPDITGPVRFIFAEDLTKPQYNVFETYMGNNNDPAFKALTNEADRAKFIREKATGYGAGYKDQTFTVWGSQAKYITISLSDSKTYRDTTNAIKPLPVVQQTYPQDAWWQNRPVQPMKVKTATAPAPGSGEIAEW